MQIQIEPKILLNMENDFEKTVLKVETPRFVPFRENNILPLCPTTFKLADPSLRIHATSAFFPMFAGILQNIFEPRDFVERVTLDKVATPVGFQALAEGSIDILCSTIPSDEQMEDLRLSKRKLEFVPFSKEPLAFLVNKANSVEDLTVAQVKDAYFGRVSNWSELDGPDMEIHTYQLEHGNGSQSAFEQMVRGNKIDKEHTEVHTMPGIIDKVALDKGGICYAYWSFYAKMYANKLTKMLKVEGEEVTSKQYPFLYDVYLMFDRQNKNPNVARLVEFVTSTEGKMMVDKCNECQRHVD